MNDAPQFTKDRPILFSGPMVPALLEDRKTQTRRVVKPQPWLNDVGQWQWEYRTGKHIAFHQGLNEQHYRGTKLQHVCPYGVPGDRLWVRETYCMAERIMSLVKTPCYRATEGDVNPGLKWTPAIYMRREHSRLTLEVVSVRVERVQEISEADAKAEGMLFNGTYYQGGPHAVSGCKVFSLATQAYRDLWDHLNAKRGYGWDVNPFVWVIEFKRIEQARSAA